MFGLRESRSAALQGSPVPTESNTLVDGTLIDLCGATLLWRAAHGKNVHPYLHGIFCRICRNKFYRISFYAHVTLWERSIMLGRAPSSRQICCELEAIF